MAAQQRLICASAELEEGGQGACFDVVRHGQAVPAFAVRYHGRIQGYLNQCGHIPAPLDFQPGAFFDLTGTMLICSVHGALYDPQTGRCLSGRCQSRGLTPLSLVERDGAVYLNEPE